MRMDQIRACDVERAAEEFIASIDPELICRLASSHHGGQPCQMFSEMKKGSFNLCYPVIFTDGEKWIVRIPWMPRIAFPEEKIRGEIATMMYITEKTRIPIPRLFGYDIGIENLIRAPFMLIEYIDGQQLSENDVYEDDDRKLHIYRQLANIFFELYEQQFDCIGALTLDSSDSYWVFGNARPLSSNINEQEVAGLGASAIFPAQNSFKSTLDYIYALSRLPFNEYVRARDSVLDEEEGRDDLYDLHKFQEILMDWVIPKYNYGPFFLMHGDLRPPNIIVDKDYNVKAIIDWEWSRTVPAQLFVPPGWLSGSNISDACYGVRQLELVIGLSCFKKAIRNQARDTGRYPQGYPWSHPLIKLWEETLPIKKEVENFCIAHALLRVDMYIDIYWKILDYSYHGLDDRKKRVEMFFQASARKSQADLLRRKLDELEIYKKELSSLGIELRLREEGPHSATPEQLRILKEWNKRQKGLFLQPLVGAFSCFTTCYKYIQTSALCKLCKSYLWAVVGGIFIATPSLVAIRRFWK